MRLKDVTECCPAYTGPDRNGTVAFVPMESLRYDSIDPKEIEYSEAKGKYTFFADGDLLFAKVTPCFENGNIAVARGLKGGIGFGSSEIFVLRPNDKLLNQYLFYVAQGSPFRDGACATMCGVGGLKRIDPLFTRTFEFDLPSLSEQRAIVAYLDEKAAAIDRKVALLEKKLAAFKRLKTSIINRAVTRGLDPKVKLKDSGEDWIGKVPVGWEVTHLKRLTKKIGSGKTPSGGAEIYSAEGVMFLRSQNVYDEGLLLDDVAFISHDIDSKMASTRVFYGDVLLNITGGSIGRCCVYTRHEHANVNQHVCIIRADANHVHNAYIKYFWNTLGQVYLRMSQLGGNRESLNFEQIGNALFPCPRLAEQIAIADYLDAECAKIDKAAAVAEKQIDAYRRLKRSLVNEVVTGKRKVA